MIKFLIPLLVAVETADGILTFSAVSGGRVQEGNPLMQSIAGTGNFLLMKICGALLCAWLLWLLHKRFPRISLIAISGILTFYVAIVAWNLSILFKF